MSTEITYWKHIGNNFGRFPYHLGLNTLAENKEEFDPRPICCPGGLYFVSIEHIFEFLSYGDTLCRISIPEGARVVPLENKYKADQIVIEEWFPYMTLLERIQYLLTHGAEVQRNDAYAFRYSASVGDLDAVKFLLGRFTFTSVICADAFVQSRYHGHWDTAEYILSRPYLWGCHSLALERASELGYLEVVKHLIDKYYNARTSWWDCHTAIWISAQQGHVEVMIYLIEHATSKGSVNTTKFLAELAAKASQPKVVEYLEWRQLPWWRRLFSRPSLK